MLEDMVIVLGLSGKLGLNPLDVLVIKNYLDTNPTEAQMMHDFHTNKDLWSVVQRVTDEMLDGRLLRYYQKEREGLLEDVNKTELTLRIANNSLEAAERLNHLVLKDEKLKKLHEGLREQVGVLNKDMASLKKMVEEVDKIIIKVREAMHLSNLNMN